MRYAFTFDAASCTGCKACQVACKDKNQLADGVLWRRVYEVSGGEWQARGAAWTNTVFAYNVSIGCNHCEDPACVAACPTGVYHVRDDGIVRQEAERCIGCEYCAWACPYGAPQYSADLGRTTKCDLCCDLIDAGLPPACVAACPMRALELTVIRDAEGAEGQRRAETQRDGRRLWRVDSAEHPFPLPAGGRGKPSIALAPHPAMTNALPKTVANCEEVRTAARARARRRASRVRRQASGVRLQRPGFRAQGSGFRREGAEGRLPRSIWSRVSEGWPLAADSWPLTADRDRLATGDRELSTGSPPSRFALRRANWLLGEWPLIAFTLLAQAAAGVALVTLGYRPLPTSVRAVIGVLLALATLGSLLHLGTIARVWRTPLNANVSPLSREIVVLVLFGVAWLMSFVSPAVGHLAMAGCGIGLVFTMAQVYRLTAVPPWNSWRTLASFASSALLLGTFIVVSAGSFASLAPAPAWGWSLAWALLGFKGWLAAAEARVTPGRGLAGRIALILVAMVGIAALPLVPVSAAAGVLTLVVAAGVIQELLGRRTFYALADQKLM